MFYFRWPFKVLVIAFILSTYLVLWGNIACNTRRARLAPSNFVKFKVLVGRVNVAINRTKKEYEIMMKDYDNIMRHENVLWSDCWCKTAFAESHSISQNI